MFKSAYPLSLLYLFPDFPAALFVYNYMSTLFNASLFLPKLYLYLHQLHIVRHKNIPNICTKGIYARYILHVSFRILDLYTLILCIVNTLLIFLFDCKSSMANPVFIFSLFFNLNFLPLCVIQFWLMPHCNSLYSYLKYSRCIISNITS